MTNAQPGVLADPSRPGAGAYNAPSAAALYARGQARAQAHQMLQADTQAPASVPPFWYLDDDGWEEARRRALKMDLDLAEQVWKTTLADKEAMWARQSGWPAKGDFWAWPARYQFAFYDRHEPLYETRLAQLTQHHQDVIMQTQQAVDAGQLDPQELPQLQMQSQQALMQASLDPAMQGMVPTPWLAALYKTCGRETSMRMTRYAQLSKEYR